MMALPLWFSTFCYALLFSLFRLYSRYEKTKNLPPGPQGVPLLGNMRQIPKDKFLMWKIFSEWAKKFGPLTYISLYGQPTIIISSAAAAIDLLETKGEFYCDRPQLEIAGLNLGLYGCTQLIPQGDDHEAQRKIISTALAPSKAQQWQPLQDKHARLMLRKLLSSPLDFKKHIKTFVAATILGVSHDYPVQTMDDPLVKLFEEVRVLTEETTAPGAFPADAYPLLSLLPSSFPGSEYKLKLGRWKQSIRSLLVESEKFVRSRVSSGPPSDSLSKTILESKAKTEQNAQWPALSLYLAGMEFTTNCLISFVLAMGQFPAIQKAAQREIDGVTGRARLPSFEDRDKMPYVAALIKELHRWRPAAPFGLAHRLINDDEYEGFKFPMGTTFVANIGAIMHNPQFYPDPMTFNPERFKNDPDEPKVNPDPTPFAFGFGRRVCPGSQLAESSLFIVIVMILSVFDVSEIRGEESELASAFPTELFDCRIKPRSNRNQLAAP